MLTTGKKACIWDKCFMEMGMNRIIPTPKKSKALLHPTICIMNHINLPTEEKEQENVINRNENDNKK